MKEYLTDLHPTRDFSAIVTMADMTPSLFAEEVVVVDFDGHGCDWFD
jgi:hypothetical protein